MEFRIAAIFAESLAQLTGDAQKAVKTTAFDLQLNPGNLGMSFHKLEKTKDNISGRCASKGLSENIPTNARAGDAKEISFG